MLNMHHDHYTLVAHTTIVSVCADCMIAAVNDDYSAIGEGKEVKVREGLERLGWMSFHEDQGFRTTPCACCGEKLHGERFAMFVC